MRILLKRARLLPTKARRPIRRTALPEPKRSVQKRLAAGKAPANANKKGGLSAKQAAIAPTSNLKKQPPVKAGAVVKHRFQPSAPKTAASNLKAATVGATPISLPAKKPTTRPPSIKESIPPLQKIVTPPAHSINEPSLTTQFAKKIAAFNKEPNIHTRKAYESLMSGLKGS